MPELTVLVVEDDPDTCEAFAAYAEELQDISLVSMTDSAQQALEDIRDHLPDAIILELELHRGSGSGLDVLRGMREIPIPVTPYILITTNNTSSITFDYARKLGADYIFSKHQRGYSEHEVLDFLRLMKNEIRSRDRLPRQSAYMPETPEQRSKRLMQRVSEELNLIGINPRVKGYRYLSDAIYLILDGQREGIFRTLGSRHETTAGSVERASQNAINRAWHTGDIDELLLHYRAKINPDKGVPTVTEFIHYYANKIKNEFE